MQNEEEEIITGRPKTEPEAHQEEAPVPKPKKSHNNKYLDESVITHLEELLGSGQLDRMERRLE